MSTTQHNQEAAPSQFSPIHRLDVTIPNSNTNGGGDNNGGVDREEHTAPSPAVVVVTAAETTTTCDNVPLHANNTNHHLATDNYWQLQRDQHPHHQEEKQDGTNPAACREDYITTPALTNTNYYNNINNTPTGGDNHFDNNVNNDVNQNNTMMDRRDSLLGLAGRIHLLQDHGTMNLNNRRGSMGSLSEGFAGGTGGGSIIGVAAGRPSLVMEHHGNDNIVGHHRTSDIDHHLHHTNNNSNNTGINNNNTNEWNQNNDGSGNNNNNNRDYNNRDYNNGAFDQDHARINYLAARAHAAQMIAVQESKRLEENLMRLEMRRVMMMKQQQRQGGQQHQQQHQHQPQPQQVDRHQQHYQQDSGCRNSHAGGQMHPPPPPHVNNTNYNMLNNYASTATASPARRNDAQQAAMTSRQGNDLTLMALAQQQINNQGQFHINHPNQVMNRKNHRQMQEVNDDSNINNSTNNMHSFMQATAAQTDNDRARTAPMPQNNINHNAYQQQQQHQPQQQQIQLQHQPPLSMIPNAPRRPLSAYNIFFSEIRNELLKEADNEKNEEEDDNNDNKETEEQQPVPGEDSQEEKQVDQEDATTNTTPIDKNQQFENFATNLAKSRLNKDPKKRAHRKTHGKIPFVSLAKLVGQKWRALPPEEKKKYQELALEDKERYRKEKVVVANAMREEVKRWRKVEKDRVFMNM